MFQVKKNVRLCKDYLAKVIQYPFKFNSYYSFFKKKGWCKIFREYLTDIK